MPSNKRVWKGKTQYKAQFRWTDENGVVHKSNTGWCNSKSEAQAEAIKLKKTKNIPIGKSKSTKKVSAVFDEFIASIEKEVNDGTLKNKSSAISMLQRANSIKRNYFPRDLQNKAVKEVNVAFFRKWLESMNKEKISGGTLRTFKTLILKFNKYLANTGYYENYNTDIEIAIGLSRVEMKPLKTGANKNRRLPTVRDIEEIRRYYEDDFGKFRNFYYYTFFYFEFYTGMRVSETIALQWKNVDLSPDNRIIYVRNAINGKEDKKTALKRTEVGNYSTKNETSERGVVIFDMIYQLLKDYQWRYKQHYKIDNIDECFVFPSLKNPYKYASHNHLLEELKRACEGAGIEELDNGMMRHGCATFLVAPPPDGLGYSPEQVYSQLGHCDSSMINTIYGKLQKNQTTQKNRVVFNDIYHPEENQQYLENIKESEEILHRVKGHNKVAERASKMLRYMMEIDRVNMSNNKVYYYPEEDEAIIEQCQFKEEYPDVKFVAKK